MEARGVADSLGDCVSMVQAAQVAGIQMPHFWIELGQASSATRGASAAQLWSKDSHQERTETMLQVTIFGRKEPSPPGAIVARGEHSSCPGSPGIMLIGLKAPLENPQSRLSWPYCAGWGMPGVLQRVIPIPPSGGAPPPGWLGSHMGRAEAVGEEMFVS